MTVSTREAREKFSDVINRAAYGKERAILARRVKALVAVVPMDDIQILEALEDRIDLEEAPASLKEVEEKGAIPVEKLKRELGL